MTQRPPPVVATGPAPPLAGMMAADLARLPPYDPAPMSADYAPLEAAALAAALGCPDLFLINAPGHDRAKWAADLAAEAARTGARILVVAPAPTADAIVERLFDLVDDVGRAVAPGEAVELLSRISTLRTATTLVQDALSAATRQVSQSVLDAEARLAELQPELVADQAAQIAAEEARLRQMEDDADAIAEASEAVAALRTRHAAERDAAALAASTARIQAETEVARLRGELDAATVAAKKRQGAVGFLKGLFSQEDPVARCADLQRQLAAAEDALAAAIRNNNALADLDSHHHAELTAVIAEQTRLIRTQTARRLAELAVERNRLAALQEQIQAARQAVATARQLAVHPDQVRAEALAQVRVVVGPAAAIGTDPLIPPERVFDMLVVADAEQLTDSEVDTIGPRADRWVLVGDVGDAPARPGQPFVRAWQRLHPRPFLLEGGRLVARLFEAPRSARLWAEPLADRPQIELRFARTPTGEVGVAEIAFPSNTPLTAVKAFLAAELGEIRLVVAGPLRWHESDDRWTACWPAFDGSKGGWVDLGGGIRERVADLGPDAPTAMVSFDKSAGWDRNSAEAWIARHTPHARTARTLALPRQTPEPVSPARVLVGVGG